MSQPIVASIHQAMGISGVSVAGERLAALPELGAAWQPLVVGPDISDDQVDRSALGGCDDLHIASWPSGSDVIQRIMTIREAIKSMGATVVAPHDCIEGYVAAASLAHRGVRSMMWHHSSGHDGENVILAAGGLADAWAAVSTQLAARAQQLCPELGAPALKELPVCTRVPEVPMARVPAARTIRLIYVGRLERAHKRVMDLALLADLMHQQGARFHMTIVGDGPARDALATRMSGHISAGRVRMLGKVSPAQAVELYGAHDVGLLVSRSEGMPLAVSECMAAGRAVAITTGCGAAVQAVVHGENGWIVPVGDMAALAKELAKYTEAKDPLARMGIAAQRTARRLWSHEALAPAYSMLINAAASAPCPVTDSESVVRAWGSMMHAIGLMLPNGADKQTLEHIVQFRDWWAHELPAYGIQVDPETLSAVPPRVLTASARLFLESLASLRARGCRRVVVYGAGAHTRAIESVVQGATEVVGIVDDKAYPASDVIAGHRVVTPAGAHELNPDAVIVSSDEYEEELLTRAESWASGLVLASVHTRIEDAERLAA